MIEKLLPLTIPLVALLYLIKQNAKNNLEKPDSLPHYKAKLWEPSYEKIYKTQLERFLKKLNSFFGEEPFSLKGFFLCFNLSLFYILLLFLLCWLLGNSGKIGQTQFLPQQDLEGRLLSFFILLITLSVTNKLFSIRERFQSRFNNETIGFIVYMGIVVWGFAEVYWFVLPKLGTQINPIFVGVIIGTMFSLKNRDLLMLPILFSFAGWFNWFLEINFRLKLILVIFLVVLIGLNQERIAKLSGYNALICIVLVFLILAIAIPNYYLVNVPLQNTTISLLLFGIFLPFLNGFWDWVSWGVSRYLMGKIVQDKNNVWVFLHAGIDLLFGLFLLGILITNITITTANFNQAAQIKQNVSPLNIEELVKTVTDHPLSPNGFWVTFMVVSTLIPTLIHFTIALFGLFTLKPPEFIRQKIDAIISNNPTGPQLDLAAWYFSFLWVLPILSLLLIGATILFLIAQIQPLSSLFNMWVLFLLN